MRPEDWIFPAPLDRGGGLYIAPAGISIDPARPVARALITHGHGDHARPGHDAAMATPQTVAIMQVRYGAEAARSFQPADWGQRQDIGGGVAATFFPAGHVLGSAQILLEYKGQRVVASGDYKRRADPTCRAFEPVPCHVFITEATFALPVFRHPPAAEEIARLVQAAAHNPDRALLVGAYALGKAQRVIALLRAAGWERPIYLHGALQALCDFYIREGIDLGELRPATGAAKPALAGEIVLAPPGALADRWSRRLPDPLPVAVSGWMRVRQRARQRGAELPLVVSDHADWDELQQTILELAPEEVWITHGREEALAHWCHSRGQAARALALVGREDEDEEED